MPDKYFIDVNGVVDALLPYRDEQRTVRFPVELAIHSGSESAVAYSSFALNASAGSLLIETPHPLCVGTGVVLHFYIPPEVLLLAEIAGRVVWANTINPRKPIGMGIKFTDAESNNLSRMVALFEEHNHLLDTHF